MNNTNELTIPQDYEQSSKYFRHYWNDIQETEDLAKKEVVNMIVALEKAGYKREESIQKIIEDHKDLKGFARATIYRALPDNMKDANRGKPKKELVQPNISNEILVQPNNNDNNDDDNHKLPTAYELSNNTDSTTATEAENIDDLDKYEQELQEPIQITQFNFRTMLSIKDQEIPVIVTVYPDKKTGYVEVDEKLARKLKKF